MSHAMERVFETPELVAKILEYVASDRPFKETRDLRLVCKTWRDCSGQGLSASTYLPLVDISICNPPYIVADEEAITKFREAYPNNSSLPISLTVRGPYNGRIYDFFVEFASIIANLRLYMPQEPLADEISGRPPLNLHNLRKLTVSNDWALHFPNQYQPSGTFLDKVLENAKSLNVFKFWFRPVASGECGITFPAKMTHLELVDVSASQIESLFSRNNGPRLMDLDITIVGRDNQTSYRRNIWAIADQLFIGRKDSIVDFEWILTVAGRQCPNLKQVIRRNYRDVDRHVIHLKTDNLQQFYVGFDLFIATTGNVYANLKSIDLLLYDYAGPWIECPALEEFALPSCPSLESATIKVREEVLFKLMPKLFATWTTVKSLQLRGYHPCYDMQWSSYDLVRFLTGLAQNEVPLQESLWFDCLHGRLTAITNLKYLESLSLEINRTKLNCDWQCRLDRFVFKAAFFRMETLKIMKCDCIKVDSEMVAVWRADNREIQGNYTDTDDTDASR